MINWFKNFFKFKTVYVLLPSGELWKSQNIPRNKETAAIQYFINLQSNKAKGYIEFYLEKDLEVSRLNIRDVSFKISKVLFTFETQYYGGIYA